jgi:hypothetical protein
MKIGRQWEGVLINECSVIKTLTKRKRRLPSETWNLEHFARLSH